LDTISTGFSFTGSTDFCELWGVFGASAGAANPPDATVPGFPPTRVPPEAPVSNPLTEPTVPVLPGRPPWRDPPADSPNPAAETVSALLLVRLAVLLGSPNPDVSRFRAGATGRVGDVMFENVFVTIGGGGGAGMDSGFTFASDGAIEAATGGAVGFGTGFRIRGSGSGGTIGAGAESFSTIGSGSIGVGRGARIGGNFTSGGCTSRGGSGGGAIIKIR